MSHRSASSSGSVISFGPFRLLPAQQLLLESERPVRLGSRALELLVALVERAGEIVSKDELVARVWPGTFVEDGNLRVHVAALRRALGDGQAGNRYVVNIPGRGYRFVAPVSISEESPSAARQPNAIATRHDLPAPLTRMVGREEIVATLVAQVREQRFITIVGPGGIGKTTVALAVAEALNASFVDRARFIDLAPLTDPHLVPSTLASVFGVTTISDNLIPALIAFLRGKELLIVFDSCEHVLEAVAALAVEVLKGAPGVRILATSREPLRAEGEHVQRLPPLAVPPHTAGRTAAEVLTFPAVQLFVERAAASVEGFELSDLDAPAVAEICRKLDGIALAIELAAGRVDAFGVGGLAALLDDRFRLLTQGRRTVLPRHQTLRAALDWSHDVLPEAERTVLRHLAVFVGGFTLEAADAVAADPAPADVVDCVANLVAKSLVSADAGGETVRYRLLDTTRAYMLEKLKESGEHESCARRHAEYYRDLFVRAEAEWETRPTVEWMTNYGRHLDNVRAALDWAFSPRGDDAIGVTLTVATVPLLAHLSPYEECRSRVERALSACREEVSANVRCKMQLYAALGSTLMYTYGANREISSAWMNALRIAEKIEDNDYQLRALWGLWLLCMSGGEFRAALELAQKFRALAARAADSADQAVGDRLIGWSLFFLGDLVNARLHTERMLSRYVAPTHRSHIIRFQYDQRLMARIALAEILWFRGFPDQAVRIAESNVEDARILDLTMSALYALAQSACLVALYTGNLTALERHVETLLDYPSSQTTGPWNAWGRCFKGVLHIKRGDISTGLHILRAALADLPPNPFHLRYTMFLGELAGGLVRIGEFAEGLATIEEAIARAEGHEEYWCIAELLRIKGEALLLAGFQNTAVAEEQFLRSLDWAREQEVLSWELRTATSLARLRQAQGRIAEARELLASVHDRFSEGSCTADLRAARGLLDELA